jgi:hypothetical protein
MGLLLFERAWTSLNLIVFLLEIDLESSHFSWSSSQVSEDTTSTEACQVGGLFKICPVRLWHPGRSTSSFLMALSSPWGHWHLLRGKRKSGDAAPGASTASPSSNSVICARRFLLRFRSLCRDLHPHRQVNSGYPSRDIVIPGFYSMTNYSSYAWPRINCSTHMATSVHR